MSLAAFDAAVTQNFDTLSNVAGTTHTALPAGWYITEGGGGTRDNEAYAVDNGGSGTGDIYSYGTTGATDRALGALRSGSLVPLYGAKFTNNTGGTITSLDISYTGEQWRLGTAPRTTEPIRDRIDFQISTNATDLSTGTYADVNALDFTNPTTTTVGAKDGNNSANRTALSTTVSGLSIPNGASFFIRWTDLDASGADDGLAVDDFSITAHGTPDVIPVLSVNDVSLAEGDAGQTAFDFTVSLSSAAGAGGVSFKVDTADGTATEADSDYAGLHTTGNIPEGETGTTVTVQVNGDTAVEPNQTFTVNVSNVSGANVNDGQGQGTIQNDDAADNVIINEVDADVANPETLEFVELYDGGVGNTPLSGLTVVFYNGNGDVSYRAFDLDGHSTNAAGYFTIGNPDVPGVDLTFNPGTDGALQNGADAVALYVGDATSFPNGTPVTDANLLDALVYDTSDADDTGLLNVLTPGQPQINEGGSGASASNSNQRCPNGSGGARNTSAYTQGEPTPDAANSCDAPTPTPTPTPAGETGPSVLFTSPAPNATTAPRDASITVGFTEPVVLTGQWFDITCGNTGQHNSATVALGPSTWLITPNEPNFQAGETCTVTVFANAVSDVDEDDGAPGTNNMAANHVWSFSVATGTAPPYPPSVHLTMGNPSGAAADLNQQNNYLMEKPEYALSYNRDRGTANWVSWHLSDEWVGTLARVNTFRPDPAVSPDWYRVLTQDYTGSGFDRGHMVPNADRDKETSRPINQATFLMTNIIPQSPDNNQGPWADMENALRDDFLPANELYIVAGGVGDGGVGSNGPANTIAGGKVAVPAKTWKVALILPKDSGDDVARTTCGARTIAVMMPNVQGIRNNDWHSYITTVDAVEAETGYDFFSNLPDAVENCVEAGTNGVNPPGTADQSATTFEDTPVQITLEAVRSNNNPLTFSVVGGPQHGTLGPISPASCTGGDCTATVTYTPGPDYDGADSFDFRASDGTTHSNVSTVHITVIADNDGDGLSDADDPDDDNDGVPDANDAFPFDPDESVDTDGDGIGNNADTDDDGDGDEDDADNCPLTPNPNQEDFDGDGIGDACETTPVQPTDKEQCKDGGWMTWLPRFKNQGDCIQFVNTEK